MPLSADERKKLLGHGGLTRIAKRTKRTPGHVSEVNRTGRPDPVVQRAIAREIAKKHPDIRPDDVWPIAS